MTTNQIVITNDGIFREAITRSPIELNQAFYNSLSERTVIKIPNFMPHPLLGQIGLTVRQTYQLWTIKIPVIKLRCPFTLHDGFLVPAPDNPNEPTLSLDWTPPSDVRLSVKYVRSSPTLGHTVQKAWLLAFDANHGAWKLPISNTYDDGSLCLGTYLNVDPNPIELLVRTYQQFLSAPWNSDLFDADVREKCQKMFRFSAKTHDQCDYGSTAWTSLCRKIAPVIIEEVII